MDKPVLIIEMPPLNDEAAAGAYNFLQELIIAFEAHYFHQLQRYDRKSSWIDDSDELSSWIDDTDDVA
jgi:hypothetical protein